MKSLWKYIIHRNVDRDYFESLKYSTRYYVIIYMYLQIIKSYILISIFVKFKVMSVCNEMLRAYDW